MYTYSISIIILFSYYIHFHHIETRNSHFSEKSPFLTSNTLAFFTTISAHSNYLHPHLLRMWQQKFLRYISVVSSRSPCKALSSYIHLWELFLNRLQVCIGETAQQPTHMIANSPGKMPITIQYFKEIYIPGMEKCTYTEVSVFQTQRDLTHYS